MEGVCDNVGLMKEGDLKEEVGKLVALVRGVMKWLCHGKPKEKLYLDTIIPVDPCDVLFHFGYNFMSFI